ncbi:MAG: hypothetical protein L3J47_03020 [Sulfurovum sp.]|nr:hypothetical protein [Sulfurovum sp.]
MKKIMILSVLLLMQGCSLNQLFLGNEIDTVHTVRHTSKVKEYRAYFSRENLKPVLHGKKYLFLSHTKYPHSLWVLLHRKDRFLLYNMTASRQSPKIFTHTSVKKLLRKLVKNGYRQVPHPQKIGFVVHTGLRKYKGIKTIMIEVKRYTSRLKEGKGGKMPSTSTDKTSTQERIEPLYPYYLHHASASELEAYLKNPKNTRELSYGERDLLEHRLATLKKEDFLENASLEELISEYKKNGDPEFKKHILVRIKELEEN